MYIIDGAKYYKSLDEKTKDLFTKVMMTTMDICSEMVGEPIYFMESAAYTNMKYQVAQHIVKDEVYNFNEKKWI